jgi:hypothetical protein
MFAAMTTHTFAARLFTCALLVVIFVFPSALAAGQDRVILFNSGVAGSNNSLSSGDIREFEVTQGGRTWSLVRRVSLPGHLGRSPVALADGSRLLWLAGTGISAAVLVQYDIATARVSVVDIGVFDRVAFLVADPSARRIAIIEPTRVTFVDSRLQPYAVGLPGPKVNRSAAAADGYIVVLRSSDVIRSSETEADVVLINAVTAEVVRTFPVPGRYSKDIRLSRDGQRLYHKYAAEVFVSDRIEVRSVATGALLAHETVGYSTSSFFELDEARGVVLTNEDFRDVTDRQRFVARDMTTLAVVGDLRSARYEWYFRHSFALAVTPNEGTLLLLSGGDHPYFFDHMNSRRVDVFDRRTYALVNQFDVRGCCIAIIPLPRR